MYTKGWVREPTLDNLRKEALVKYSPIKVLTTPQKELINEIESNPKQNYVINGDAGTGKTVLLTHLVAQLLTSKKDQRIAVVVQPNWIKTAKDIFRVYGYQNNDLEITTSTRLINANENYDVIIVDEAHKMSRKFSKQIAAFKEFLLRLRMARNGKR